MKNKPIEVTWNIVKGFVAVRNVSCNNNDVMRITDEKFSSVSKDKWVNGCT
jgi:hypothetical protein